MWVEEREEEQGEQEVFGRGQTSVCWVTGAKHPGVGLACCY